MNAQVEDATASAAGNERSAASTGAIPYEDFLRCVHCGLCTAACPTYQ